jgi:hypothetical protein
MLAKCSNPSCFVPFCYLQDGRLFRLESDPALPICSSTREEYFWLCPDCSSSMTLHLEENGIVVAVQLEPFRSILEDISHASVDRRSGLLLRSISSHLPLPHEKRKRTKMRARQDVA